MLSLVKHREFLTKLAVLTASLWKMILFLWMMKDLMHPVKPFWNHPPVWASRSMSPPICQFPRFSSRSWGPLESRETSLPWSTLMETVLPWTETSTRWSSPSLILDAPKMALGPDPRLKVTVGDPSLMATARKSFLLPERSPCQMTSPSEDSVFKTILMLIRPLGLAWLMLPLNSGGKLLKHYILLPGIFLTRILHIKVLSIFLHLRHFHI